MQGLDKRANVGRVDLLLILDYGAKYLGPGGVLPKVLFNGLPELECDEHKNRILDPSNVFTVKVSDRETISSPVPIPCSSKGLDTLSNFTVSGRYPVI